MQPFILVAASSELRWPGTSTKEQKQQTSHSQHPRPNDGIGRDGDNVNDASDGEGTCTILDNHTTAATIKLARARRFVRSRLAAYTHILPLKKVSKILELVGSVWAALDDGELDVYWMDIAHRKGLRTIMG